MSGMHSLQSIELSSTFSTIRVCATLFTSWISTTLWQGESKLDGVFYNMTRLAYAFILCYLSMHQEMQCKVEG
eukprot:scaffold68399_cov19-Tisochrysis_lutea.AAC.1